jgi:hypothetical protein
VQGQNYLGKPFRGHLFALEAKISKSLYLLLCPTVEKTVFLKG